MSPIFLNQPLTSLSSILTPLSEHLAVQSILAGNTPAVIWVDDTQRPSCAFAWANSRYFLSGTPASMDTINSLQTALRSEIFPRSRANGLDGAVLFYTPTWSEHINTLLQGVETWRGMRELLVYDLPFTGTVNRLPAGFKFRKADADLLKDEYLRGLDALQEEMKSERSSVAEFLQKSFGLVIQTGNEIIGWCLSEYNTAGRCEIGIAVSEEYRRRGLGLTMTHAFLQMAEKQGIKQVGWDCWVENHPSGALARRAGFRLLESSPTVVCVFN